MTTFISTGCPSHPVMLSIYDDCMTCTAIISAGNVSIMWDNGPSQDNPNSVYPEITDNLLAGPVGFVNPSMLNAPGKIELAGPTPSTKHLNKLTNVLDPRLMNANTPNLANSTKSVVQRNLVKRTTKPSVPSVTLNSKLIPALFPTSFVPRKIISSFIITKDFHPGQNRFDQNADSSEHLALSPEPVVLDSFLISRDWHRGQARQEPEDDYSERFALDYEDLGIQPVPKLKSTLRRQSRAQVEVKSQPERPVAPTTSAAIDRLRSLVSKQEADTIVQKHIADLEDLDGDTIIVDVGTESEDEDEPLAARNARKRLEAARDELLAALLADKESKKGVNNKRKRASEETSPDLVILLEEASPRKRAREVEVINLTSDSEEEEPPLKRTRAGKQARLDLESDEEKLHAKERQQIKRKIARATVRRSARKASPVMSYAE